MTLLHFKDSLRTYLVLAFSFLFLVGIQNVPAAAQVAGGTIQGTVTDPKDAVIPKAQISVKNLKTDEAVASETNNEGFFTVPNLVPGKYEVSASLVGFATQTAKNVLLTVGGQQSVNFKLKLGAANEQVDVSTVGPAVETTSSTVSGVVGEEAVRELPLNGRSWTDLASLQTGVNAIQTQPTFSSGPDRGNRGFGLQLTISGARPQQNNYRLDGVSINDYANGAPGSVLGGNLGVDAIQEFSVLTSNYSAEYGKTSGGVVNAITRSGGNRFHGSLYEFTRNSIFDARNYFDQEQLNALDPDRIPPFKRNQFGGALGGPIIKNRTFFFADYEGIRQSKGISSLNFVPSVAARSGSVHDTTTGQPMQIAVDPASQKYLTFFPLPNGGPTANPDVSQYFFSGQQIVNENFFTTRVDHKISDKDSVYGTYLYDKTPYSSPDGLNNVLLGSKSSRQILVLEANHIFSPTVTNNVRFGYNTETVDNNKSLKAINPAAGDLSFGALPGRTAANVIIGDGITQFSGGTGASPTYFYDWKSYQGYDDAIVSRGNHTIKFGFAFERMLMKQIGLVDANGIFRFPTLIDFLQNQNLTSFNTGIASSLTPRNFRQNLTGVYLQDDWRFRSNLTINAGIRYETASVPTETNGKLVNLRNIGDAQAHLGDPLFANPTLLDFEPRIGFAWDPFKNGKTAVRGGFGIFDVQPLLYQFTLLENQAAPFFLYSSINSFAPTDHVFYNGVASLLNANTVRSTFIPNHSKRDYVMQWNLNVQHELTHDLTAMVAYVASRGVHQPFRVDDADFVLPMKTDAGYLFPAPIGSGTRVNENFGSVRGMFYTGRSYYNAMEAQLSKRVSHGVQAQAVFTYGKSIDTSSATVAGDAFGNSISSLPNWFNPRLSRGLSDFNVTKNLTLNAMWDVPSPKSIAQPLRWAAGGWQLGGIFTMHDGVPFTPTFGTDGDPQGLNSSDPWAFPNRLKTPGCGTAVHPGNPNNYIKTECFAIPTAPNLAFYNANCDTTVGDASLLQCFNLRGNAGRNSLIGPGTTNLDISIFKNNHVARFGESFNVQFRAELFNVLNHANFAPPTAPTNTDIFDSTGARNSLAGALTSTVTTAREIQFAIKVSF